MEEERREEMDVWRSERKKGEMDGGIGGRKERRWRNWRKKREMDRGRK